MSKPKTIKLTWEFSAKQLSAVALLKIKNFTLLEMFERLLRHFHLSNFISIPTAPLVPQLLTVLDPIALVVEWHTRKLLVGASRSSSTNEFVWDNGNSVALSSHMGPGETDNGYNCVVVSNGKDVVEYGPEDCLVQTKYICEK